MSTPIVPRPAATVMVVRDAAGSLEVLMLRRSLASEFISGAYVFPGGALDAGDGDAEMFARCTGRSEAQASSVLELDSGGLAYWVAAFRECFEEAGVLVAAGPDGSPLTFDDPATEQRFVEHRRALNAGQRSFLEICAAESLTLPADAAYYVSHWITPEGQPRRYDTRFFAALAPRGQTAVHDAVETIDHRWIRPDAALAQHQAGEIEMVAPTISNLRLLSRFATTADLVASVSKMGTIPTILPRLEVDAEGRTRLVIPGAGGEA